LGKHQHILNVDKTYLNSDRIEFYRPYVENKKVLHVGFVDWPKPRPHKSLHLQLAPFCKILDGIDPNVNYAESLAVPNGKFFKDWNEIIEEYDVILVPEVIEHVDCVRDFLKTIDQHSGLLIVSAPDAYLLHHHFQELEDGTFHELVHPDHKCWYSAYTLTNTINSYSQRRKVSNLYWLAKQSIVAVCTNNKP